MSAGEQHDVKPPPSRLRHVRAGFARAGQIIPLLFALGAVGLPATVEGASSSAEPPAGRSADHPNAARLPGFEGRTLDGKHLATSAFTGKRLLLFCFNPKVEQAKVYAQVLAKVAPERTRNNFAIVGVAMGLDAASARAFAAKLGLDFPIFDDSRGDIGVRLGLQSPVVLLGADGEGRVGFALAGFEAGAEPPPEAVEAQVRKYLRLPVTSATPTGLLDQRPMAPPFEGDRLDGGGQLRLADLAGKPVVLTFFLSTCPHCQTALRFWKQALAHAPETSRPVLVGVALDSGSPGVEARLAAEKLDYFPVLRDPKRAIASAYGAFAGVPDIVMIDASGRIAFRGTGWDDVHDPPLMRMRIAAIAGEQVPMLLAARGFSGNEKCGVCHPQQMETWRFTDHSVAFDTLVTRGADRDPECVRCHVVGFGEPGGYSESKRESHLEDVGCEVCHGLGGGHLKANTKSVGATASGDYRAVCARCHDPEHSLGFEYASFLPKVSHVAIAALADAERAELVAGRGQPRDLLPTSAALVGSEACKSCHQSEYATWSSSFHARSIESLQKESKETEADCLRCHVTGYGRPGGFPDGGPVQSNADLARVGCESCHGPGGEHVKDGGTNAAGIVRLADKCDSCVILQICGACHDDVNDPEFRFEVTDRIDAQRHGSPRQTSAK